MALKRRKRDWEADYQAFKADSIRVAEEWLTAAEMPYQRLQFICAHKDGDYDALLYVWDDKGARTLSVRLPVLDEEAEPKGAKAKNDKAETVSAEQLEQDEDETEDEADGSDEPDLELEPAEDDGLVGALAAKQ